MRLLEKPGVGAVLNLNKPGELLKHTKIKKTKQTKKNPTNYAKVQVPLQTNLNQIRFFGLVFKISNAQVLRLPDFVDPHQHRTKLMNKCNGIDHPMGLWARN